MFFDNYPEFVENDVRKDREHLTVTSESLSKRCDAILPKTLIQDKTVLDVGSALGAMGHYALKNGASYYCGVELQKMYRDKSIELLRKYNDDSLFEMYETIDDVQYKSDIVIACGYIHSHFNVFDVLKKICGLSNRIVVIETHDPLGDDHPVIRFNPLGKMVRNDGNYSTFEGIETLPNKLAVDLIMAVNGFSVSRRILPEQIKNSHDAYNTRDNNSRFISLYVKDNNVRTLEDHIYDLAIR
jgi:hypothetical protein